MRFFAQRVDEPPVDNEIDVDRVCRALTFRMRRGLRQGTMR